MVFPLFLYMPLRVNQFLILFDCEICSLIAQRDIALCSCEYGEAQRGNFSQESSVPANSARIGARSCENKRYAAYKYIAPQKI
jgi:hypothetical protein